MIKGMKALLNSGATLLATLMAKAADKLLMAKDDAKILIDAMTGADQPIRSNRSRDKAEARRVHVESVRIQSTIEYWATWGGKVSRGNVARIVKRVKGLCLGRDLDFVRGVLVDADENRPEHPSYGSWMGWV